MRTRDRIVSLTALGLLAALSPAFAFEGTVRPPADVPAAAATPAAPTPAISRALRAEAPRPPASIPSAAGAMPVACPMPRCRARPRRFRRLPHPAAPLGAAAAAAVRFRGTRRRRSRRSRRSAPARGRCRTARRTRRAISLEYAAEQGLVGAQWKLGRMYAEGDGVDQSDIKALRVFQPHRRTVTRTTSRNAAGAFRRQRVRRARPLLPRRHSGHAREAATSAARVTCISMRRHTSAIPTGSIISARLMLDDGSPFKDPTQAARGSIRPRTRASIRRRRVLGRMLFQRRAGHSASGRARPDVARRLRAPMRRRARTGSPRSTTRRSKQATEEERALAGDYLMRWMNATARGAIRSRASLRLASRDPARSTTGT